jgi:hypothetical protein
VGAGDTEIPGFHGMDGKRGDSIYPLEAEGLTEIRASHCLEHFPALEISKVVADWVRALEPGGTLKIAVPDFKLIAQQYALGAELPFQSFIMGGQVDERDYHKALFDESTLSSLLRDNGLVCIRRWRSEINDCAALPISLNLAGTKPMKPYPKISAVISVPRLGFNDFWSCAYAHLTSAGVMLRKSGGAYWERDLAVGIEQALDQDDPEYILTCDYDSIFTSQNVHDLIDLARRYPHADAIAPIQPARHHDRPIFTAMDAEGKMIQRVERDELVHGEVMRIRTAHFGLTLFRADKLKALPKPWMQRKFDETGGYHGESAMDPDVQFWESWANAGNSLYVALRVPIGHADLVIRWPNQDFETLFQTPNEYWKNGIPTNIWR